MGALVIIGRSARRIGMERPAQITRGIVPAHDFAGPLRCRDFAKHLWIIVEHAGEIHHFAEADDVGPGHGLNHIVRTNHRSACFKTRRRRHAGRHLNKNIDGQTHGLVMHQLHACQPQHIGDLVGINEHGRSAMGYDRTGEFGHRHHAAFHMHVAIAETRNEIAAIGFNDFCIRADAMGAVFSHIGKAPVSNGDIRVRDDFTGMHIHPTAFADHQIRRRPPHGHVN